MLDKVCYARLFSRCLLIAALLGIAACQTAPKKPAESVSERNWLSDSNYFKQRLLDYQQTQGWRFSAKVGIKTPQLQEQANLVWQFADQSNDVRLFGPLGVGSVKLEFDQYSVQLKDNKGLLHRGVSAQELLTKIVGWPIPVDALSYWLHGLPSSKGPHQYQLNEINELVGLKQFGWAIKYAGYQEYQGRRLARKLTATKQVSPEQSISVKLVTKSWQWQ